MKIFVIIGVVLMHSIQANAALVTIASDALQGKNFSMERGFGGVVGDTLSLVDGEHHFTVKDMHNYNLNFTLNVSGDHVSVKSKESMRWDSCINGRVSRFNISQWAEPTVKSVDQRRVVEIFSPDYKDVGDQGECKSDSSHQTLAKLGSMTAKVESEPSDAVIYIRGKNVGTTDTSIAIPFTSDHPIDIVLRKRGYVNCRVDIQPPLSGDSFESISCFMIKL